MDNNIEKKENNDKKYGDDDLESLESLIADLNVKEDEIIAEAIELVEHALSLVDSQYFDDAIEILRQAIGLYSNLGRNFEIDAINQKISEIYILKEQAFKEVEFKPTKIPEELEAQDIDQEQIIEKSVEDLSYTPELLLEEATKLVEIDEFDEALDKYDEAIKLFREDKKDTEIERVYELIDKCYDVKAEFLKKPKEGVEAKIEEPVLVEESAKLKREKEEKEKLQKVAEIEKKKAEEEDFQKRIDEMVTKVDISIREYEREIREGNFDLEPPFEEAIKTYKEVRDMLREKDWKDQTVLYTKQIDVMKQKLEKDKKLRKIEAEKREKDKRYLESLKTKRVKGPDIEKAREVQEKRKKDEEFQKKIDEMVTEVDISIREYDRAIREGYFDLEPPYEKAIKTYEEVRDMLKDKDWKDQIVLYTKQIDVMKQKLEKDKKLRKIEAEKREKDKKYLESLKTKRVEGPDIEKAREVQEKRKEDEEFQKKIDEMVTEAEGKIREYDMAIRKGDFDLEPPYEKAIKTYEEVRDMLKEKDWKDQTVLYTKQIDVMKQKLEKDKKLRKIEAEKREKDKKYLESLKTKRVEGLDIEKAREVEEKRKKDEEFQSEIDKMVDKADASIRDYERAIRKGDFDLEPPYEKAIKTYEEVRDMLKEKDWKDQTVLYTKQIDVMRQKLEKDKKLREVEAEKREKDKIYLDSLKTRKLEGFDAEKAMELEKKRKEDEEFQSEIDKMVDKADASIRDYERAIRKGDFDLEPPYEKAIEIYGEVREKIQNKGWHHQADVYLNQINSIKKKLEQDKKLRELEGQKEKSKEEFEKFKKQESTLHAGMDRLKALEEKYREDEIFQQKINDLVNEAEGKIREYDMAIRKGNFDIETPFNRVITIYEEVRDMLKDKGWNDQIPIYIEQIKITKQRQEADEKLREIEMAKVKKQKEYELSLKAKKEDKGLKADLDKIKDIQDRFKKELEEEEFENQITALVDKADEMVRKYELAIRYGQFEEECIYPEVIEIYEEISKKLSIKGWEREYMMYNNQIKLYQDKLEHDKKLREVEAQKRERDLAYLEALKAKKDVGIDIEKLKKIEERAKDDELFQQEIDRLARQAENSLKNYELAIRHGKFETEPPFEEVLSIYSDIRDKLVSRDWKSQAAIFAKQIDIIKQKKEKDKKLREIEIKKLQQKKEFEEQFKIKETKSVINLQKLKELELKKKDKEALINEAFRLIDESEKLVKKYELTIKKDILQTESPYEGIIEMYKAARKIFLENKWENEASKLINTIKYYKERKEKDEKLRAIEAEKLVRDKIPLVAPSIKPKKTILEKEQIISELEKEKREKEDFSSETFKMIDKAEKLAKNYEFKLKEGIFLDCPYEQIIKIYRGARKKFEEFGWKEQSSNLISTINHYKDKLGADKKLRELEKEKIEKQKREMETKLRLAEKERERKKDLRREKEKALLLKSKEISPFETQKDHAFRLMDQAKHQFNLNNFDIAIELYKESENIFSEINWPDGLKLIKESVQLIKTKKEEFAHRQKAIKEKQAKILVSEKELEKKAVESQDLIKLQQQQKRKKLLRIQEQKILEKETSDRAYDLLEQGTRLLKRKKFEEAQKKYTTARNIFEEIGWSHEVSRINSELLFNLKKEEKASKRIEEYKAKKLQEEKEIEILLNEAEKEKDKLKEIEVKEKREKMVKIQTFDKLKDKIKDKLNEANIEIIKFKYNEGILIFKDVLKMMERLGWEKEIKDVNAQIRTLEDKSRIPLIVLEEFDEDENMANVKAAYQALDKAQMSFSKDYLKKAISELNEAKFNLSETKIGKKFIGEIEDGIKLFKEELEKIKPAKKIPEAKKIKDKEAVELELTPEKAYEFMDKCKRAERRNRFEKAIEFAKEAKDIFTKMGQDWIKEQKTIQEYIDSLNEKKNAREQLFKSKKEEIEEKELALKKEEEEFKAKIAARREERSKRIKELIKK